MIFDLAEKYPPHVCRAMARTRDGPKSSYDIASETGLSASYVKTLSLKTSWRGVAIEKIQSFMAACGIDPLNLDRFGFRKCISRRRMPHLKNANPQQRKMYAKIFSLQRSISQASLAGKKSPAP